MLKLNMSSSSDFIANNETQPVGCKLNREVQVSKVEGVDVLYSIETKLPQAHPLCQFKTERR